MPAKILLWYFDHNRKYILDGEKFNVMYNNRILHFTSVNILIDEGVHHYVFIASYLSTNIKL